MIVQIVKTWRWIVVVVICAGCAGSVDMPRGDVLHELQEIEEKFLARPEDENMRFTLAEKLFDTGDFSRVKELLAPIYERDEPLSSEALLLLAKVEYLVGHYDSAETLLLHCIELAGGKVWERMEPKVYLLYLYYQTNEYAKGAAVLNEVKGTEKALWRLFKSQVDEALMLGALMNGFGQDAPYHIDWNGHSETVLPFPFLQTEEYALPVVDVELNGVPVQAFIDSGGDTFTVTQELAAALGIEALATSSGFYAGGASAESGYARADSLKLGDIVVQNLPIEIELIDRCHIGTGVLRQFLATLDYPNDQLILRPKNERGKQLLQQDLAGKTTTKLPFTLMGTHLMFARGRLNERMDLTFLVDSGLEDFGEGAAFTAPAQTLEYANIPMPETTTIEGMSGAGTVMLDIGYFPIDMLGLGEVNHEQIVGMYGPFPPQLYHDIGFLVDGIISHNYLRHYAWTIDFKEMTMILAQ